MNTLARISLTLMLATSFTAVADSSKTNQMPMFALKRAAQPAATETSIDRPIIVQFWATWCKTCGETMAFLDKRNAAEFNTKFYTVAVDDEPSAVKAYLGKKLPDQQDRMMQNTFIDTDANFAKANNVSSLPHVVVMDATGKILMRHVGHPDDAALEKMRKLIVKS